MKKLLLIIIASTCLSAGEIVPIWKNFVPATVLDMELLPNGDEALLMVGNRDDSKFIKISTDDGSVIDDYQGYFADYAKFEILADSLRIITANNASSYGLQTRDISNLSIIDSAIVKRPEGLFPYINNLVVDPIRPLIYANVTAVDVSNGGFEIKGNIQVYNYETMEYVKNLTDYIDDEYSALSISDDGKYLAAINDGIESYLKIWDLESDELVINESLFAEGSQDDNEGFDIYFSKNDRNIIYLSGLFSEKVHQNDKGGKIYKFYMDSKARELIFPNEIYGGLNLLFIDNENILINSGTGIFSVFDLIQNNLEYYNDPKNIQKTIIVFNKKHKYFLGIGGNIVSKFFYDGITSVEGFRGEINISPNPTGSYASIELNCSESIINYSIYDYEGNLISDETIENQQNGFSIDFSNSPTGVYFLSFECNNQINTYKIMKEG